jgi:hypothetical protein
MNLYTTIEFKNGMLTGYFKKKQVFQYGEDELKTRIDSYVRIGHKFRSSILLAWKIGGFDCDYTNWGEMKWVFRLLSKWSKKKLEANTAIDILNFEESKEFIQLKATTKYTITIDVSSMLYQLRDAIVKKKLGSLKRQFGKKFFIRLYVTKKDKLVNQFVPLSPILHWLTSKGKSVGNGVLHKIYYTSEHYCSTETVHDIIHHLNNCNYKTDNRINCATIWCWSKQLERYCTICRSHNCLKCKQSHELYACPAINISDEVRQLIEKKELTLCPSCGVPIYRIDGCDHMKCTKCFYEFYYCCGEQYKPGINYHCRD